jgi:uncharacterized protein (DUF488 family)
MRLFTVGHGARTSEELVATLGGAGVETLVDVRRYPSSRWHPQFNRAALEETLRAAGLDYVHAVELGGKRKAEPGEERFRCLGGGQFQSYAVHMVSEEWQQGLERALARPTPCFMCAETHWLKCHRRFISELLVARGHEVVHLLRGNETEPHQPMLEAECRDGRLYLCGELVS